MSAPHAPRVSTDRVTIGGDAPPLIIAGPDTLESEELCREVGAALAEIAADLDVPIVFKGSYDKANRSSHTSYRGPGIAQGLDWLDDVRERTGMPVTTDVHTVDEMRLAGPRLDIIQIPAFLCRQNDLLVAAGETGRIVNIKKGQFLAPSAIASRIAAARGPSTPGVLITERGTTFGHGDLVNDFRGFAPMRALAPLVFDATHSAQKPGALGDRSGGNRDVIPDLARAAAGTGCDGYFFEVHPDPDRALCDGPNSLRLEDLAPLLREIIAIDRIVRRADAT